MHCMAERGRAQRCPNCGAASDPPATPLVLPLRTVLNERFIIGRVLGRPGGFGITYLAWDLTLRTTAAIKEYLPSVLASRGDDRTSVVPNSGEDRAALQGGLDEFLAEAQTLVRFSHRNIARVRDYLTANNTAYLVMDYYRGIGLDQYVRERGEPLGEHEALEIILPVLGGVEAVHAAGFLHRDIKPPNIHLTSGNEPILLDFGAARYAMSERSNPLTVMLTAGFAPFEQYHRRGNQGPWTDIYACGATLYYLLTGSAPPDSIERYSEDTLEAPVLRNPAISESFSHAVVKALAIDPASRPQEVRAFRDLLLGSAPQGVALLPGPLTRSGTTGGRQALPARPKRASTRDGSSRPSRTVTPREAPGASGWSLGRVVLIAVIGVSAYGAWQAYTDRFQEGRDGDPRWQPAPVHTDAVSLNRQGPAIAGSGNRAAADAGHQDPVAAPGEVAREGETTASGKPFPAASHRVEGDPWRGTRPTVPAEPYREPPSDARERPSPSASASVDLPRHGGHRPPTVALDACAGKRDEVPCSLLTPHGRESGICRALGSFGLACMPFRPPPESLRGSQFERRPGRAP